MILMRILYHSSLDVINAYFDTEQTGCHYAARSSIFI